MKIIINVDPETGETDNFLWAEKEEPPPLVRGREKISKTGENDMEEDNEKSERNN